MNSIERHIMPLVGSIVWKGFDKDSMGNLASLLMKFNKHIHAGRSDKLKEYLAFCIQTWPNLNDCPVDQGVLREALSIVESDGQSYKE